MILYEVKPNRIRDTTNAIGRDLGGFNAFVDTKVKAGTIILIFY